MIQIDDSGSGSLVGGTCIGAIRKETGEYFYNIIPLSLYQQGVFEKKFYLDEVLKICQSLLVKLNVEKNEEIEVCRGYMFERLIPWLRNNQFRYISTSIKDPLQTKIENTFEEYAIQLGLPMEFINYTKYPFHFHRLLRWVYADYENRYTLCKTGWKSWKKYGSLDVKTSTTQIKTSKYRCLKCWRTIEANSSVKVIKYISNKPNVVYLHNDC